MQKGFATLEIIFAVIIVAVLTTCALPNAVRMIDNVALDYEYKRLYSELRFLQAVSRSTSVSDAGTGKNFASTVSPVMKISPDNLSYQIKRGNDELREAHKMHYIANLDFTGKVYNEISFDDTGKSNVTSNSIILTSRLGKSKKIVFDSVGRIRGGRDNE